MNDSEQKPREWWISPANERDEDLICEHGYFSNFKRNFTRVIEHSAYEAVVRELSLAKQDRDSWKSSHKTTQDAANKHIAELRSIADAHAADALCARGERDLAERKYKQYEHETQTVQKAQKERDELKEHNSLLQFQVTNEVERVDQYKREIGELKKQLHMEREMRLDLEKSYNAVTMRINTENAELKKQVEILMNQAHTFNVIGRDEAYAEVERLNIKCGDLSLENQQLKTEAHPSYGLVKAQEENDKNRAILTELVELWRATSYNQYYGEYVTEIAEKAKIALESK